MTETNQKFRVSYSPLNKGGWGGSRNPKMNQPCPTADFPHQKDLIIPEILQKAETLVN